MKCQLSNPCHNRLKIQALHLDDIEDQYVCSHKSLIQAYRITLVALNPIQISNAATVEYTYTVRGDLELNMGIMPVETRAR